MKAIVKLMDPFSKFNGELLGNLSEILSATKVLLENFFLKSEYDVNTYISIYV